MSRPSKPLELQNSHLTKEEIETREKAEKMLKVSDEKVYKKPKKLKQKVLQNMYLEIVNLLKPLDILSDLDIDLICTVVESRYQMEKAMRDINKNGQVIYIKNENGDIARATKNPSVEVYKTFEAVFSRGCGQLGMSPASRASLSISIAELLKEEDSEENKPKLTKEELEMAWLMESSQ